MQYHPNAMWQDSTGKVKGTAKGVITMYARCDETVGYDSRFYTFDSAHKAIMTEEGYTTPQGQDVLINFEFSQKERLATTCKMPVTVSWRGPEAILEFVSFVAASESVVLPSVTLPESLAGMTEVVIVPPKKKTHFECIFIRVAKAGANCAVAFSYVRPKPVKKLEGLGADLEADEVHKDVTIHCADGETVKVHKTLLQLYSPVYSARFLADGWNQTADVDQPNDSHGAWQLIVASLYGHDEMDFTSPYMADALYIADRDGFAQFSNKGWTRAVKAIDKESVLPLLSLSWPLCERDNANAKDFVRKCLEFFIPKMSTMDGDWLIEYAGFLRENPKFSEMVTAFDTEKRAKKRTRSPQSP